MADGPRFLFPGGILVLGLQLSLFVPPALYSCLDERPSE